MDNNPQNLNSIDQICLEFLQKIKQATEEEIKKKTQIQTENLRLNLKNEIKAELTEQIKKELEQKIQQQAEANARIKMEKEYQERLVQEKIKIEQKVKEKIEKEVKLETEVKDELEITKRVNEKLKQKAKEISPLGVAERQKRRDDNLQNILLLAEAKGEITNDMVQKELLVSDSTATNYLNDLVARNELKQSAEPNHRSYRLFGG